MQQFSLEAILISSLLSFVLSGLLVSLFKDWLDRAKLDIAITSLGLEPSHDLIELPEEIQRLSESSSWIKTLHRFEKYQKLNDVLKKCKRVNERLRIAKGSVDQWLQENKSWDSSPGFLSSMDEMAKCPFFRDQAVGSLLMGAARRGEGKPPPMLLDELKAATSITELADSSDGWHLYMGASNILFPKQLTKVETERKALHQLALSFSVGSKANLFHYMDQFRQLSAQHINELSDMATKLERILLPASLLSIQVSITNSGTKPATFRPFSRLNIHNPDIGDFSPILKIRQDDRSEKLLDLSALLNKRDSLVDDGTDGDEVVVEELLPQSERNDYLFIPPKTSLSVQMVSTSALADHAERVIAMYKAAVLRCSVIVLPMIGRKIMKSPSVLFGKSISKDELALLDIKSGDA